MLGVQSEEQQRRLIRVEPAEAETARPPRSAPSEQPSPEAGAK